MTTAAQGVTHTAAGAQAGSPSATVALPVGSHSAPLGPIGSHSAAQAAGASACLTQRRPPPCLPAPATMAAGPSCHLVQVKTAAGACGYLDTVRRAAAASYHPGPVSTAVGWSRPPAPARTAAGAPCRLAPAATSAAPLAARWRPPAATYSSLGLYASASITG
jgi:hypothetical protein